jgi:hypothetical protein
MCQGVALRRLNAAEDRSAGRWPPWGEGSISNNRKTILVREFSGRRASVRTSLLVALSATGTVFAAPPFHGER